MSVAFTIFICSRIRKEEEGKERKKGERGRVVVHACRSLKSQDYSNKKLTDATIISATAIAIVSAADAEAVTTITITATITVATDNNKL